MEHVAWSMERWRRVRTWETGDGSEHSRALVSRALPLAARMPLASSLWPGVPAAPQRRTFLLRFGVTRYCYCLLLLALACLTEVFWFDCDVSYSYIPKGQRASASPGVVQTQPAPRKRRRIPTFWAYAHYHCVRTHLYPPVSGIRDPVTM
eukprot:scaffold28067_cov162-Isochrysis_galbana.AAC.1